MKVKTHQGVHAAIVVVDVLEGGELVDLLKQAHISKPFPELTIIERHAGEIGTLEYRVCPDERYFIIVGLGLKE